ncbi:AraC family transcriptional regulator [Ktedonosporobacter rubrisoli]|uniref:AraC family transcriptional regulator n=1 Tax=Ktedonosporobacter rubrisoli TaxID=2509675 RepID=A0A4P6JXM9_KTERU|nr:AraC family transcriptional regulator [Ktedonosporobacter rubrisoli]QBD80404.1 AraC family transcriptional regulator [Ktedonosporobacter rubrisoli]
MNKNLVIDSFEQQYQPVFSSKSLGWNSIEAARYFLSPGHVSKNLPVHLLLLYLGEPSMMVQMGSTSTSNIFVKKGEHAFVPAGRRLEGNWSMDADFLFLNFDPIFMRSLLEASDIEANRIELLSHSFLPDQESEQLGQMLLREIHSSGFNTRLYAESLATTLALHLLRHYSTLQKREQSATRGLSKTQLRQTLEYVHEYYAQDLSVAELAAAANVSPSHFARLFKRTIGMAPHEYLIACRIECAKKLLLTEDISIHEIASQCGFADQSHLTRHFQRMVGVTPGELRKDRRNVLRLGRNVQDREGPSILHSFK